MGKQTLQGISSSPNFHSLLASYGADNKKGVSIISGSNLKQHMQESSVANGTSASESEIACTNNTSASIVDGGISNTSNGDLGSATNLATSNDSGVNTPHIPSLSISGSRPILQGASFNNADTRAAHE